MGRVWEPAGQLGCGRGRRALRPDVETCDQPMRQMQQVKKGKGPAGHAACAFAAVGRCRR
jgi:hypothetical protein